MLHAITCHCTCLLSGLGLKEENSIHHTVIFSHLIVNVDAFKSLLNSQISPLSRCI